MNIINFTPVSALTGGLLIGLSVALFFILNGRMIGISGIASNFLVSKNNRIENFLFLAGLILGPLIYNLILGKEITSDNFELKHGLNLFVGMLSEESSIRKFFVFCLLCEFPRWCTIKLPSTFLPSQDIFVIEPIEL